MLEVFEVRNLVDLISARGLSGVNQVSHWTSFYEVVLEFKAFDDASLYRKIRNFWAYAKKGLPFTFSFDKDKSSFRYLSDIANREYLVDGDFEQWNPGTNTPSQWTKTEVGGTLFYRETKEGYVESGSSGVRIYNDKSNVSYLSQTTSAIYQIPASKNMRFSIYYRASDSGTPNIRIQIQDLWTSKYLNNSGAWQVAVAYIATTDAICKDIFGNAYGNGKGYLRKAIIDFTSDTHDAQYLVRIYTSTSSLNNEYFDKASLRRRQKNITLWNYDGFSADDYIILESRSRMIQEVARIQTISGGLNLYDNLENEFIAEDIVRHQDCYRLIIGKKQNEEPMWVEAGLIQPFKMKCESYVSARPY